jgi:hypothetical protein
MGTHRKIEGNIEGTSWEQRKNGKTPPCTQNLKEKKSRHLECMLQPTHWLHVIFGSKTVGHHFWHGLMARSVILGHRSGGRRGAKYTPWSSVWHLFSLPSCTCFWALHGSTCSFYSAKELSNVLV